HVARSGRGTAFVTPGGKPCSSPTPRLRRVLQIEACSRVHHGARPVFRSLVPRCPLLLASAVLARHRGVVALCRTLAISRVRQPRALALVSLSCRSQYQAVDVSTRCTYS